MENYSIHPVDAVVFKNPYTLKTMRISLCSNGSATTPEQRKEAELLVRLLNWYDSIDKNLLNQQLNILRELGENFDDQTLNGDAIEGIGNMVSDLLIIGEDLQALENVNHKDDIEQILIRKWGAMGMDIPENLEEIVQYVFEDVMETSDYPNYNDDDVMIGFRRWVQR